MVDGGVLAIVWAETFQLKPKNNDPATMQRLQAVVGKLAAAAKTRGLEKKLRSGSVPDALSPDLPAFTGMQTTISDAENQRWTTNTPLPARAVLWEITEAGTPPRDNPAPASAAWILEPDAGRGGDFTSGEGANLRTFRLFESMKVPAEDELPYISALTGSGVPAPKKPRRRWYRNVNWWIGLGGGALFLLVAFNLAWTAASFSRAYDLLIGRYPDQVEGFTKYLVPRLCTETKNDNCAGYDPKTPTDLSKLDPDKLKNLQGSGATCVQTLTTAADTSQTQQSKDQSLPKTLETADVSCLKYIGYAVQYASRYLVMGGDGLFVKAIRTASWSLLHWLVPADGLQHISLGTPMTVMMLGVVLMLLGLGRGVTGRPLGVLMSPQNRYSLSIAQVTFWTVLILTSVTAIAIFNAGLVAEHMRYFTPPTSSPTPAPQTNLSSLVLGFFPDIPPGIWLALGISMTSAVASSWIKWLKGSVLTGSDEANAAVQQPAAVGLLGTPTETRQDPEAASIADWFLGEDIGKTSNVDISRVQVVMITAGLLITYGQAIFASVGNLTAPEILLAVQRLEVVVGTLPVVTSNMAVLLAVSHATYIGAKAVSSSAPSQQATTD